MSNFILDKGYKVSGSTAIVVGMVAAFDTAVQSAKISVTPGSSANIGIFMEGIDAAKLVAVGTKAVLNVRRQGIARAIAGSAIAKGDPLTNDANGHVVPQTTSGGYYFAVAEEAADSGAMVEVMLLGANKFAGLQGATEYTATSPAAIPARVNTIELNHATVAIEKTIASLVDHQGIITVKDTSASGTAAHKITVTTGTWDGTNKVITLNAPGESITCLIDSAGNGVILNNTGSVALS